MFERFTSTILDHWKAACLGLLILVSFVTAGIGFLRADFSVKSFYGRNDPETTYLAEYQERWGGNDLLFVIVDGGEDGLLGRERLRDLDELTDALEAVEGTGKVLSLTRTPRVNRVAGLWIPVPLLATAPGADKPEKMERWRESVLADPQVVPAFLSEDGRYGTFMVSLDVDTADLKQVRPVVKRVQELVDSNPVEGVEFHLAGVPAIRAGVLNVVVRDQILFVPLAGTLIGILLYLLFKSRHGVVIPAVAAAVPMAMLLGIMGWTGEPFGLLNQVLLALVPAIAVADAIHLVSRYHEELAVGERDEAGRRGAVIRAMGVMGVACFLTSFTTFVGFMSLLETEMPILRMFGLYAAIGVGLAYFTVLFIVPLALKWTRADARLLSSEPTGIVGASLNAAIYLTTRRPWAVLVGAGLLAGFAVHQAQFVQVDTKVTQTFEEEHPTAVANMVLDQKLGGVMALEFDLVGEPGQMTRPDVLEAIQALEEHAMGYEGVRATLSPAATLRAVSRQVGGPDALPSSDGVRKRLLQISENVDSVRAILREDEGRARILIRTVDMGSVDLLNLADDLKVKVDEVLTPLGIQSHLTGSSYVAYRGMSNVTVDLRDSLLLAFAVIGVIIALLFRNLGLGLVSLIPNALPLLLGYGMMGLFGWSLEPAPAVVFTIAIGISVDSAIHVIARYREERQLGKSNDESITSAIIHSGRAIGITCVILGVGFAVNIQSSSPANASFGRLGTVIIFLSMFSNLLVLPAILKVVMRDKKTAA